MNIEEAKNVAQLIEYASGVNWPGTGYVPGATARQSAMQLVPAVLEALDGSGPDLDLDLDLVAIAPWPEPISASMQLDRLLFGVWMEPSERKGVWAQVKCAACMERIAEVDDDLPRNLAWLTTLIDDHQKKCPNIAEPPGDEDAQDEAPGSTHTVSCLSCGAEVAEIDGIEEVEGPPDERAMLRLIPLLLDHNASCSAAAEAEPGE